MLPFARTLLALVPLSLLPGISASATSVMIDIAGDEVGALDAVSLGEFVESSSDDVLHWSLSEPLLLTDAFGSSMGEVTSWNVALKEDPFVTNNINVTNTSAFTQIFIASVTMPIPAFAYDRVINSSVAITATDSNGDNDLLVATDGGTDFYRGRVDDNTLLALTPPGIPLTTGSCTPPNTPGCTASTADGTPLLVVPAGTATEIEIILRFALSAGDSVGITSRFEIIPEPTTGTLVGLGLVGLAIRRRLRR